MDCNIEVGLKHHNKWIIMRSERNSRIVYVAAGAVMLFIIIKMTNVELPACDDACQQKKYKELTDLGKYNVDGFKLLQSIEKQGLNDGEHKELTLRQLFGDKIREIIFVERMTLDFGKKCDELPLNIVLEGKDYCQVAILRYENEIYGYLLGRCEYDLMGFTKSYDKLGFNLSERVQTVAAGDSLTIEYSSKAREFYSIEPKKVNRLVVNCD